MDALNGASTAAKTYRTHPMLRTARAVLAMLVSLGLCVTPGQVTPLSAAEASEYDVKAAFLVSFARFVDWPATNAPLTLCALADETLADTLGRLAGGETVNGRAITVRRILRWDDTCNIVFIGKEEKDLFRILRQAGPGVLTVGEDPNFLREGGIINFVLENRKVRFDVNLKAAGRTSVVLSSRLLTVARNVIR